jgi:hypothetical protein
MAAQSGSPSIGPDPYAKHRIRIITVSGTNRITSDTLQSWSAVTTTSTFTGESVAFPAAEIPSGVLERHADGRELLQTVDGLVLELDGEGGLHAHDAAGGPVNSPAIFMVVEIIQD